MTNSPTLKDAKTAIKILKSTIDIRNNTKEDFEINDDIEICQKAIDCIMEDINYDCYLDNS
tara:strand:+ start:466 stop:648 length:183 start_codon:yes stop_codon:yes gene_type:complete